MAWEKGREGERKGGKERERNWFLYQQLCKLQKPSWRNDFDFQEAVCFLTKMTRFATTTPIFQEDGVMDFLGKPG